MVEGIGKQFIRVPGHVSFHQEICPSYGRRESVSMKLNYEINFC